MKKPEPDYPKTVELLPRIPAAVLEQRALERWEGEGGALPVNPSLRPEAGRRNAAPKKKRGDRKAAPATGK